MATNKANESLVAQNRYLENMQLKFSINVTELTESKNVRTYLKFSTWNVTGAPVCYCKKRGIVVGEHFSRMQCGKVRRRWCADLNGLGSSIENAARQPACIRILTYKFCSTFLAIFCRHTSKILRYTFGAIRRMTTAVDKEEARKRLTSLQWHVTQEKGTERWGHLKGTRDNFETDIPTMCILRVARDNVRARECKVHSYVLSTRKNNYSLDLN